MSKKKAGKTLQPGKKYSGGVPQKAIQPSPLSGIQPDLNQKLELATEGSAKVDEILPAVVEFVDAFYWVFHLDWITTKRFISDADAQKIHDTLFGKEGTFAKPTIADASKDWLNRGRLLSAYNRILGILQDLEDRAEQADEFSYHLHTIAFDDIPPSLLLSDDGEAYEEL